MFPFKALKELSCSCNVQPFEKSKCWYFFFQSDFYLFCKKRNMRLEILFSWSFVSFKGVMTGYNGGGGGHVFFYKYSFNLPYILIQKILFSYILFVKGGLPPCNISFLVRLHFLQGFLYRLEAQSNTQ